MTLSEPLQRFTEWFAEAKQRIPVDPNAMVLATVGPDGRPSTRVVLLKDFDARGFVFYTNFHSRKGSELLAHPDAALCFYWPSLERQVRIEGTTQAVDAQEADAYFASRARESQIGAWASLQSQPLPSREALLQRVAAVEQRYAGQPVPRPPHWSGFLLVPRRMEFWQAGKARLHQRDVFIRETLPEHAEGHGDAPWTHGLLFP